MKEETVSQRVQPGRHEHILYSRTKIRTGEGEKRRS